MSRSLIPITRGFFIKITALTVLFLSLIITISAFSTKNFSLFTSAKKTPNLCEAIGGVCTPEKSCNTRGGVSSYNEYCNGSKVCCFSENIPTPTPSPRIEYQGENIKVVAECTSTGSINLYIVDDGVDESPNGTWTYLIVPAGEYSYLAYTGPTGGNSSVSIYGITSPIRGNVRETIQSLTTYTAGIAHGSYTTTIPVLQDPRYELTFTTPNCN